jgi:hypothetical protein
MNLLPLRNPITGIGGSLKMPNNAGFDRQFKAEC